MYTFINNMTEYNNKLYQAEYAYDHQDYATAGMYFLACLRYAEAHGLSSVEYLKMKVQDCKHNGYTD